MDQKLVAKVAESLRQIIDQGGPSIQIYTRLWGDPYPTCMYRGPNGRKCAVGAIMPDSKYSPDLEVSTVGDAKVRELHLFDDLDKGYQHEALEIFSELQNAHDRAAVAIKRGDMHEILPDVEFFPRWRANLLISEQIARYLEYPEVKAQYDRIPV